jgi:hypothetical protein
LQLDAQVDGLAEGEVQPFADQGGKALELESDGVGAQGQQRGLEEAAGAGAQDALVAGGGVDLRVARVTT